MPRFVVGDDRSQSTLFPERLEDYLSEDNPVRAIEVFAMSLIWPGGRASDAGSKSRRKCAFAARLFGHSFGTKNRG